MELLFCELSFMYVCVFFHLCSMKVISIKEKKKLKQQEWSQRGPYWWMWSKRAKGNGRCSKWDKWTWIWNKWVISMEDQVEEMNKVNIVCIVETLKDDWVKEVENDETVIPKNLRNLILFAKFYSTSIETRFKISM